MSTGNDSILDAYLYETNTLLEQLDSIVLASEEKDTFSEEDINTIFRIMHTIKGSSAMMEYRSIMTIAHRAEDLFSIIRDKSMDIVPEANRPELFELLFEGLDVGHHVVDLGRQVAGLDVEAEGGLAEEGGVLLGFGKGVHARDGLDAADAGGNARFAEDLEGADVARAHDVRAAAELDGVADRLNADDVAVLFAEEHRGAGLAGFFKRQDFGLRGRVGEDLLVDEVFDAGDLLGRHGLAVGEVEAQLGRGDEGALLFDVLAEDLTQGLLEKVGR